MKKKWYQSNTIRGSFFTGIISLLSFMQGHEFVSTNPGWVAGIGVALSVLNVLNRFRTDKKITL